MTRRALTLTASLLALGALTGCVSKKDHEALQAQLAECQNDKRAAQSATSAIEGKLANDNQRWEEMRVELGEALPRMKQEFEEERKRIMDSVPKSVRAEVGAKLDRHFARMSESFVTMGRDMEALQGQLEGAREEIAQVKGQTAVVETKVDVTNATLDGEIASLKGELEEKGRRAAELTKRVTEFDKRHLTCDDCEEKLKMKAESREALLELHGELVTDLASLQSAR